MTSPTETPTPWWRYIQLLMELHAPALNKRTLALALDIAPTTVGHWEKGSQPRLDAVHAIAELFDRPLSEVFIKAEYATPEQLGYTAPPLADIRQITNAELLDILRERLIPTTTEQPVTLRPAGQNGTTEPTPSGRARRARRTTMARERSPED